MTKKQYAKMDWAGIEAIVYSDSDHPYEVLAPKKYGKDTLVQAFLPFAEDVELVLEGKEDTPVKMELVDEEGFWAVFLPGTAKKAYCFKVVTSDGGSIKIDNPYDFAPVIPKDSFEAFVNGNCFDAYRVLGSHEMVLDGKCGVNFAVWAPNALRVSVVGEWNHWDGRVNPMQKLDEYGIFTLFIPNLKAGDAYRYEIKVKGNEILLKDDPYATVINEDGYSVVAADDEYNWTDGKHKACDREILNDQPVNICQISLIDLITEASKGRKKLSNVLSDIAKNLSLQGYTHVALMPVAYHSRNKNDAYQTLFYYAVDEAIKEDELKMFINECHKAGLDVLLDWSVAFYAKDANGLEWFDGSNLYEHADKRQGYQPVFDANVFQYQRPEAKSFLTSNAFFWLSRFHFDGLSMRNLESVLYLDYGRNEWVCNAYGGKENLEFVDFIKELNNRIKSAYPNCVTIADIDAVWADVSEKNNESLGFDFVWNNGFKKDLVSYVQTEHSQRSEKLLSMLSGLDYAYNENFILPLSNDVVEGGMLKAFPGIIEENYSALRTIYAYTILYPGKKLYCPDVNVLLESAGKKTKSCEFATGLDALATELYKLYTKEKLLFGFDDKKGSLQWVDHKADVANVVTFIRKSEKKNEILYVVANFSNDMYENLKVVVPFAGKYSEILSTDYEKFGGRGSCNTNSIATEEAPYDENINLLAIKAAPMSVSIFAYRPFTAKELADIAEHKRQLRIAYVKAERAKIEKYRDEIIAEAIKNAEMRIKELEKILEEK